MKTARNLAIAWTIVFFADLLAMATGDPPSWILVFIPLTVLISDRWTQYFQEKRKNE